MFIEDLDLLGESHKTPIEFRAMVVRNFMDLEMITVRLVLNSNNPLSHVFLDPVTQTIYSRARQLTPTDNLYCERPHHMEIVKQDWVAFQKQLRMLRFLFKWFVEGRLEETELYPWLFEIFNNH